MPDRLLIFLAQHARLVPEGLLRGLFLAAADLCWLFRIGGVRQLERNLAHVMPEADRRSLRRTSRQGMRSYFVYFVEALTVGARTKEQLLARIHGGGSAYPDPARTDIGLRSLPIGMGHQGNWDYAGFWACSTVGQVTTVAERLRDQGMLNTFADIRRRLGMNILLTGEPDITGRLTTLLRKPDQVVPLLADRDLSHRGVFVKAFDSWIRVAAGPAVIALDARLPLYTVNMHRERLTGERRRQAKAPYGYVCQVDGPIPIKPYLDMPREQAINDLTQAWVDQWAQGIREHPEDWHMLQPIFLEDLDLSRMHDLPEFILAQASENMGGDGHEGTRTKA